MSKKVKNKEDDKPAARSRCYHVVDGCGCIVGTYCCDGPDMTNCKFESRC